MDEELDLLLSNNATEPNLYTSEDGIDAAADDDNYVIPLKSVFVPPVTSLLSMLGSFVILREVLYDHRHKKGKAISRVLMCMCFSDFAFSLGYGLSTFPAPKDLDYLYGNIGNTRTCEFQGFLLQLGLMASPMFSALLCLFFMLTIRYNWTDAQLKKFEFKMYAFIWVFALAMSIFPIPLGLYNNTWEVCWIDSYPQHCEVEGGCTRGENASALAIAFSIFPVWPCILLCIIFMTMIYLSVRKIEHRNARYASGAMDARRRSMVMSINFGRFSEMLNVRSSTRTTTTTNGANDTSTNNIDRRRSRQVAVQALYYMLAFVCTYTLSTICVIAWRGFRWTTPWLTFFAFNVGEPLQGFFNCLVFIRNRDMKTSPGKLFRRVVCCCCIGGKKILTETTAQRNSAKTNGHDEGFSTNHPDASAISPDADDDDDEEVVNSSAESVIILCGGSDAKDHLASSGSDANVDSNGVSDGQNSHSDCKSDFEPYSGSILDEYEPDDFEPDDTNITEFRDEAESESERNQHYSSDSKRKLESRKSSRMSSLNFLGVIEDFEDTA